MSDAVHAIDSLLYRDRYTTPELRAVFSDEGRIGAWLRFESALADAQAELGMVPEPAARAIAAAATIDSVTPRRVAELFSSIGLDTVALVRALAEACGPDAGRFVHWGATTTDVLDTGLALQLAAAWRLIVDDLQALRGSLVQLADDHRDTLMVARTHSQHALPITFGFKVAMWVDALTWSVHRLSEMRSRVLVGKVTGAAGSQASFGRLGPVLQQKVCDRLALATPTVDVQISRARYQELLFELALIANTLDQIAHDVWTRQRPEIGELEEPFATGAQVGSSTLAFKRNPFASEWIRGKAAMIRHNAAALLDILPVDERDGVRVPIEYALIPESCLLTGSTLRDARRLVDGLVVHTDRMESNLESSKGMVMSEAIMMALAGAGLGKQVAHDLIYRSADEAYRTGRSLLDVLRETDEIHTHMDDQQLTSLMDAHTYLGSIPTQIDEAIDRATRF